MVENLFTLTPSKKDSNLAEIYIKEIKKIIFKQKNDATVVEYKGSNILEPIQFFLMRNIKLFKLTELGSKKRTWEIMRDCEFHIYSQESGNPLVEFISKNNSNIQFDSTLVGGFVSAMTSIAKTELYMDFTKILFDTEDGRKMAIVIGNSLSVLFIWDKSKDSFEEVLSIAREFLGFCETDSEKMYELHNSATKIINLYDFL